MMFNSELLHFLVEGLPLNMAF